MMRHVFGVDVPVPDRVTVLDSDLTETRERPYPRDVHERRADTVLLAEFLLEGPKGRHILVVESQSEVDKDKKYAWPYYIAFLRDKYKCDVSLLVICNKASTAAWARRRIVNGFPEMPSMVVELIVAGPDNMPRITDVTEACTDVGFTVLAALTHAHSTGVDGILKTLATALGNVEADTARSLAEFTALGLTGTEAIGKWRELMKLGNYPYKSELRLEFEAIGEARGEVRGRAECILKLLDLHGVTVTVEERAQISSCTDLQRLGTWFDLAATGASADELFACEALANAEPALR